MKCNKILIYYNLLHIKVPRLWDCKNAGNISWNCICTFLGQEMSCTKSISRVDRACNFFTVSPQCNAHKYQAFLSWRLLLWPLLIVVMAITHCCYGHYSLLNICSSVKTLLILGNIASVLLYIYRWNNSIFTNKMMYRDIRSNSRRLHRGQLGNLTPSCYVGGQLISNLWCSWGENEFPYVSLDVHSWQNLCWPLVLLSLDVRYWCRSMSIKLFCISESKHSRLVFLLSCRLSHSNVLPCLLSSLVSGLYNRYLHRVARLCTYSSDLVSHTVLAYSTLGLTM